MTGDRSTALNELEDLRARVAVAEELLRAIRSGEIDAIVVDGDSTPAIYTLKGAADPYRSIVEQMAEGALTVSNLGVILYCNNAFSQMIGRPREKLVGTYLSEFVHRPRDFSRLANFFARGVAGVMELQFRSEGDVVIYARVSSAPLAVDGERLNCLVVTDLSRQELRVWHEAIVNSSADAIFAIGSDGMVESWNPAAERLFGYSAEETVGTDGARFLPEAATSEANEAMTRVRAGLTAVIETTYLTKAGSTLDTSVSLSPIKTSSGEVGAIAVIARDVSERKTAEKQIHLLMREVSHRAKNLLAVVQGIANLTSRQGDARSFAERFSKRIAALANFHDLLVQSDWRGVEISELLRGQLKQYGEAEDRISVSGPRLRITGAAAQAIGMATNATKYGALSNNVGKIAVHWLIRDGALHLQWKEVGGPPPTSAIRSGFGHTVMLNMIESSLKAKAEIEFTPAGCVWTLVAPLAEIMDERH
jgi:PAS domain S-box-containing protein